MLARNRRSSSAFVHRCSPIVILLLSSPAIGQSSPGPAFVVTAGQVTKLFDVNADGDFLDFAESIPYAAGLPASLGAAAVGPQGLYVTAPASASVMLLRDLNADGDALDFGEVVTYAVLPAGTPTPVATGAAIANDGSLYVADLANHTLYRARDLNLDGDALDFGEIVLVAQGFAGPVALAALPNGCLLAADSSPPQIVRILRDRDSDGDFLDFAENISYAEQPAPGADLAANSAFISFLVMPPSGSVLILHDRNADGDALDFAEVVPFAAGLPTPARLAVEPAGSLLVACNDAAGSVYRLADLNADGDALDFGEALLVATGLVAPLGVAVTPAGDFVCIPGDANGDGQVTLTDVAPFVNAVLSKAGPLCALDLNFDGLLDARDLAAFCRLLAP